jgi:phosphopentomutase
VSWSDGAGGIIVPTSREPRATVLVLDSVGVGALPDAGDYGDSGSDTLGNTARAVGGLCLPNLARLGIGNVEDVEGVPCEPEPVASWGRMAEISPGKDTTTGHWEMMGVALGEPFPVYPDGFPDEVMDEFSARIGRGWLGNEAASGTEIIARLGDEHVASGKVIVYTSADSVFQVAAHEDVVPIEELYRICGIARAILTGKHRVARVIARPFIGESGAYVRTHRRRDFAIEPPEPTVLDVLTSEGVPVLGVGKIGDIFCWRGVSDSAHVTDNMDAFDKLVEAVAGAQPGFVFANLVDFDMLWGHRNDVGGYAKGLEEVDVRMPELLEAMVTGDLLVITSDHGCDPTTPSTDHSREHALLLAKVAGVDRGVDLGCREGFADVGESVLDFYGLSGACGRGTSFLGAVREA